MKRKSPLICLSLISICSSLAPDLKAGPRASASYSIPVEMMGGAGHRAQSASYSLQGNAIGEFAAGQSPVATIGSYTNKPGFVGELYDIVALSVTAPPSNNLNESSSRQLQAAPLADDSTTLAAINPSTVAWSIITGPLTSISSAGLANAGIVYQDTPATAGAAAQSLSGQLNLTVLNVANDDYQSYAGDQIDDSWQVQYFGQPPNANAGPNADPDGDGQNNFFEFTAGIVPNNAASRFVLNIQVVTGQPSQKRLIFNPIVSGRTYTVLSRPTFASGTWAPLTGTTQSDSGNQRTVIDLNGTGATKFYRIDITKP